MSEDEKKGYQESVREERQNEVSKIIKERAATGSELDNAFAAKLAGEEGRGEKSKSNTRAEEIRQQFGANEKGPIDHGAKRDTELDDEFATKLAQEKEGGKGKPRTI